MEKWVRILDRIAASICLTLGGLIALAGVLFIAVTYMDHGTMSGHEFTLMVAATMLATGGSLTYAARSMQQHSRWRWVLHALPIIILIAGYSLAILLSDSFTGL
ncbi:MAG: hypothetical protein HYZ01_04300 [Ignavibacteriales bacterium]|nr:hypothetical protein [Ignavibacteriales bacterium]